jgi:cyclic pyranopterin phosphate synthase
MAAKNTSSLIPLCHNVPLDEVNVEFSDNGVDTIFCTCAAEATYRTGVEMEAIVAVMVALATVYDMAKAVDRSMVMGNIRLLEKSGGRSGHYVRVES